MSVREISSVETVLINAGAVELVPQSYCEHILGDGCKVWAVKICPSVARFLLERNEDNRRLMKTHAESLSRVLSDKDWVFNGKTICIDSEGSLLDGQHRLTAATISGEEFDSLVVTGIPRQCFSTIDTMQRTRTHGQVLEANGERNSVLLAAAARVLYTFCKTGGQAYAAGGGSIKTISPAQSERIIEKNPDLRDSVSAMASNNFYRTGNSSVLHYLFGIASPRLADDFAVVMREGSPDRARPFNLLRESFINFRYSGTPCARAQAAKAVKAFNAEVTGKSKPSLHYRKNEEFPRIAGLDYGSLDSMI
jgi:hypothetical protein